MGLFMDTGSVKSQLNQMNIRLAEVISQAMRLQGSISAFTETTQQLQGESYDSIRNYYSSTHLPALRGLICHVEELKAANDKYASQIDTYLGGISYVDEDGLGNSLDMIILAREQVTAMTEVTAYMRTYDNLLAAMQRGIEDKINKIACFKAATSGIYSTLESDKGLLQTGIACMEGIGFNSKTKTFSMGLANLSWIAKLNEKWEKRIDVDKLSEEVFEKLGDDALTYEEYSNLSEIKQLEYLEKVAEILVKLIPNTNLSMGDELEIAIGPDMTAYYQIRGELDTNPDSALNVEVVIKDQKMILESFTFSVENSEVVFGLDGSIGYRIGKMINQNTEVSAGVYADYFDSSIKAEMEVSTSLENSSVTSTVGVKKSISTNIGWEPVPVVEPVPVIEPIEEENLWDKGWNVICGIGEGISNGIESIGEGISSGIESIGDWLDENKETVENVITVIYLFSFITSGGMSPVY